MRERFKNSLALQLWGFLICIILSLAAAMLISTAYVKSSAQQSVLEANDKILQQVESKLDTYYENIRRISQVLSYSPTTKAYYAQDERGRVAASDSLDQVLSNMMLLNDDIVGVYLYDMEDVRIAALGTSRGDIPFTPDLDGGLSFGGLIQSDTDSARYFAVCNPVFDLDSQVYGQQIGMAVLLIKPDGLQELLMNDQATKHTELYLVDGGDQILASQNGAQGTELIPELQESDRSFLVESRAVRMEGWQVFSRVPREEMYSSSGPGRSMAFLAYVLGFLMIGVLARFCYQNIVLRMHKVDQFIREATLDQSRRMEEIRTDEIGNVVHSLNHLLDEKARMEREILQAQQRAYEAELSEKQLQILAYRNQINPHFLYNTFECVRSMAMYYGVDDIAEITMALSNLFRFAAKGSSIVPLREEIDYVKEYATIIDFRFMGKIEVDVDVSESLLDKPITKLILQPLVENAVFHGLEKQLDGGTVQVSVLPEAGDRIRICVEDDGCGIEPERLEAIRATLEVQGNSKGIGLSNIYQRLNLFYGSDVIFEIDSEQDKGTRITVVIPDHIEEGGSGSV